MHAPYHVSLHISLLWAAASHHQLGLGVASGVVSTVASELWGSPEAAADNTIHNKLFFLMDNKAQLQT